jgi:hypothetical protein
MYDRQISKTEEKEGAWLRQQVRDTDKYKYLRYNDRYINQSQRWAGGVYGRHGTAGGFR